MRLVADIILSYPKSILVCLIVVTIASLYPASRIDTDFNLEGFFPENASTIDDYYRFSDEFGRDDNLIAIAFESDNVLSRNTLQDIYNITEALDTIPNTIEVISLTTVQELLQSDGALVSRNYIDADSLFSDEHSIDSASLLDRINQNPFAGSLIINESGTVTALFVRIDDDLNSFIVREQVINDINQILGNYAESYHFRIAGIPFFRNTYVHMLNQEIVLYISISSVFILMLLWGLFRNVRGVLIPISIVWLTILFTVAVIVLTGGYFEVLSSTIAPILLCVGIADSVHLLSKYQDSRLQGMTPGNALRDTIIILGSATLLTSITTAIGFGTLLTSNVIPMQRFGIYTAAGVIIAFLITILLLPTILPYFKEPKNGKGVHTKTHQYLGILLKKLHLWVLPRHKVIVISTILVSIVFAIFAAKIKVNGKIFDDVGPNTTVMQDSNFFTEKLAPQFPLEFVIDTGEPNGAYSPDLIQKMSDFESVLTNIPEIERATSLATLLSEIHRVMSPEDHAVSSLPESRELIAQYLVLFELTGNDALEQLVDFDYQILRIAVNIQDAGSYRVNQIRDEITPSIREIFSDFNVTITGTSILVADLTENIVYSLASSIMLAFVFISLIMGWLFKNLRLILISILPNIIPLIVAAGTMGMLGIDLKPSTAVIFTIAFGIAVDDSIHYLARLRIEIGRCGSLTEAIAVTSEKTGRAIVLTSLILVVGFGTLATSAFTSTMLMGALTCLTVVTAIIADLVFLPALLHWVKPDIRVKRI